MFSVENKFPSARFLSERLSNYIPIIGIFGLVCSNSQSIRKLQTCNNWISWLPRTCQRKDFHIWLRSWSSGSCILKF